MHNNFSSKSAEKQRRSRFIFRMCSSKAKSQIEQRIFSISRSNRLALVTNHTICIISLNTSEILIEISLDLIRSDEYNSLNCLTWSNNGKLLAYGHWSGIVCVYSTNDGQLLHELQSKTLLKDEDSFVKIWFSGSDASQFIDLLCLKRTGELLRYVMSRDDIASCAEEKFDFRLTCASVDSDQNLIYLVPFERKSIFVYKIVDTNPSIMKIKEMIDDEQQIFISKLVISIDQKHLVACLSNQSIVLYENSDYFRCLSTVKLPETRSSICDFEYWDDKTLLVFYSDGSISFHEGKETLEEYRFEPNQLHSYPHLCSRTSNELFLIDTQTTSTEENDEENTTIAGRFVRSWKDSTESVAERLLLFEHTDPDRLIENLISTGDYGEALRVCKVFNRNDLSDRIHEIEVRSSSSQIKSRLTRIQSRLHVMQLCTSILYATFDEQLQLIQFGLDYGTREEYFQKLSSSEEIFHRSIHDEKSNSIVHHEKQTSLLNYSQKQVLFYRKKLLDDKRKLFLYEDFIQKCKMFGEYHEKIFERFRSWDYKQIALRCAREGFINGLRLVLDRSVPSLSSIDVLLVLSEIPESISLSEYEDLIPKPSIEPVRRAENDWSEKYLSPIEEFESDSNREVFVRWFDERIHSFEAFGFVENAFQLSKYADDDEQFRDLKKSIAMEFYLNKISENDLTLKQIEQMSDKDLIDLLFQFSTDGNQDEIDKRVQHVLIPILGLLEQSKELIRANLIEKLQSNFNIYPIVRSVKSKSIYQSKEFDELVRSLILNINSPAQISIGQKCLTLISNKQDLEFVLESCRIFLKWSVQMIPSEMMRIFESEEALVNAIVLLIQSAIREDRRTKMTIATGDELYHDIEQISSQYLSSESLSNVITKQFGFFFFC